MSRTVLIVDDSPILRRAIRKVVALAGIDDRLVHEAGNGIEALEVLEAVRVDLVLLDLNMPAMDGEQLARQIAERPDLAHVSLVVVSAESNRERLDRVRGLGVAEVLHKPFEPEELCRVINRTLGARA